ncbi:hypothetical protein OG568_59110 (plasmid) [Streptomyces sp. NBC_01450]|nr:hypothetical protein [Streptomyces sp. NBC_01450]
MRTRRGARRSLCPVAAATTIAALLSDGPASAASSGSTADP